MKKGAKILSYGRRREGLTLVELVVAMVLLTVLGFAVAGLLFSVADAEKRLEVLSSTHQIGRFILSRLMMELSSTFPLPVTPLEGQGTPLLLSLTPSPAPLSFFHEDNADPYLGLDFDTLRFTTAANDPRRSDVPQTELIEVFYFVDKDPETPEQGLVRRVGILPGLLSEDAVEGQMQGEVVSPRVVAFNCRFYDPDVGEWSETWERTDRLPASLEVTVGVAPLNCDTFLEMADRDPKWLEQIQFFSLTVPLYLRSSPPPSIGEEERQEDRPSSQTESGGRGEGRP